MTLSSLFSKNLHLTLPKINVKIDLKALGTKVVAAAGLFAAGGALAGVIPGKTGIAITTVATAVVMLRDGVRQQPTGIVHAVSPDQDSLTQTIAQGLAKIATAPAAKRNQTLVQTAHDAGAAAAQELLSNPQVLADILNKTGLFQRDQLAQSDPAQSDPAQAGVVTSAAVTVPDSQNGTSAQ